MLTISIEMMISNDGIGSMIWSSWQSFAIDKLYVSVMLAGVLGLLSGPMFQMIEHRFVPWRSGQA